MIEKNNFFSSFFALSFSSRFHPTFPHFILHPHLFHLWPFSFPRTGNTGLRFSRRTERRRSECVPKTEANTSSTDRENKVNKGFIIWLSVAFPSSFFTRFFVVGCCCLPYFITCSSSFLFQPLNPSFVVLSYNLSKKAEIDYLHILSFAIFRGRCLTLKFY